MTSRRPAPHRVLILGGSSEASALVRAVAGRADIDATLSLAGRTATPVDLPVKTRVGGFGGVAGLVAYIESTMIDMVVDATHPFAALMSQHASSAATRCGIPCLRLTRPAWTAGADDRWHEVAGMTEAAEALGSTPRRVFLTVGRLQLAAFAAAAHHHYVVRTIDPVPPDHGLQDARFIQARGPFEAADEERLMRDFAIDVLITKNSGGAAAVGKLDAARALGVPVVLVRRPPEPGTALTSVAEVLAAIEAHARQTVPRGV